MSGAETGTLLCALDGFAEQFLRQMRTGGMPSSEHAVHFCFAYAVQVAFDLPFSSVVFEQEGRDGSRTDLWFRPPLDMSVEVKYQRPVARGANRPLTQWYGSLLADFNKVHATGSARTLVVLVADEHATEHLATSGLLAMQVAQTTTITEDDLGQLPRTARLAALSNDEWATLTTTLLWQHSDSDSEWRLSCWEVAPASP